ncbi:MAG: YigZ family protein [Candidatus Marinimicrobia bacterium]|nr:YigZ family protein [Candidatus Neomarinimicrobiota bacterium]
MKYRTIANPAESRISVRGSKFLGYAFPAENEETISAHLNAVRKQHYSATHHCFAWQLGYGTGVRSRYHDDGEPSGTAGNPIHRAILRKTLTNVLVISVRYFGGTKLGTGGLIRAYGRSAAETLNAARVRTVEEGVRIRFQGAYEQHPHILRTLNTFHVIRLDQDFGEDVTVVAEVDEHDTEKVLRDIRNATRGEVRGEICET